MMKLTKAIVLAILAGNVVNATANSGARCYQEPAKQFMCIYHQQDWSKTPWILLWKLTSAGLGPDETSDSCDEATPTEGTNFGSISADCGHDTLHYVPPSQTPTSNGGVILDNQISDVCVFPDPQKPGQYAFLIFKYTDLDIVDGIFTNSAQIATHHKFQASYTNNPEKQPTWQTGLTAVIKTTRADLGSTHSMVTEVSWNWKDGTAVSLQRNNDMTWSVTMGGNKVAGAAKCLMHSEYYSTGVQHRMQTDGKISAQTFDLIPTY